MKGTIHLNSIFINRQNHLYHIHVGRIFAHNLNSHRQRPVYPGVSMAHKATSVGTLGAVVKDNETGELLLLSNNHVFANCNRAKIRDVIIQPCKADGGLKEADAFARLERFVPLKISYSTKFNSLRYKTSDFITLFMGLRNTASFKQKYGNQVDAAVARPDNQSQISLNIPEIGSVKGVAEPVEGMQVQKYGRSTGLTRGTVKYTRMDLRVHYPDGTSVWFIDQIVTSKMSEFGDSGALLLDMQNRALGLLCGGSEHVSVFSPIQTVLDLLNISLVV